MSKGSGTPDLPDKNVGKPGGDAGKTAGEPQRYKRCFYYEVGNFKEIQEGHVHYCAPEEAKTLGDRWTMKDPIDPADCEKCPRFKSRFIEYPLTINELKITNPEPWGTELAPVRIRPCNDIKTYFGVYLGEFPRYVTAEFNEETGTLEIKTVCNPCIYVPELHKAVFGDASWWGRIKPENIEKDIQDITDETIQNQWYVKMLKNAAREKKEGKGDCQK